MKQALSILILFLLGYISLVGQEKGYVLIPRGDYQLGDTMSMDNPKRTVQIESFWIAQYELTNAEFEKFVQATGYQTLAERYHNA
ncbi:MAG: SUMF1/EgtB/PvdO family nonheme iron enzyme, partial [Sphingobacterium sp.]